MANTSGLKIKFGLGRDPSDSQAQRWAELTRNYIRQGLEREAAGHRAAKELFTDYQAHFYASEADTLEALLRAAEGK